MKKLVSIIIPCFNSERWLKESIESCLNQTYAPVEVIVIDDGSTDASLEIIKRYGDKIRWETGPNRGANYARNRGFALSKGDYIQYLDADDLLLPEKIAHQLNYLEETGADVVCSDYQRIKYLPDGTQVTVTRICGPQDDFLEFLLLCKRWMQTANPLFKRAVIEASGGWDETLKAAQDVDLHRAIAINGAKFVYLPGIYMMHRVYESQHRVSTNYANSFQYHVVALEKAEAKLTQVGRLSPQYKRAMANHYFRLVMAGSNYWDASKYKLLLHKIVALEPEFQLDGSVVKSNLWLYRVLVKLMGFVQGSLVYRSIKQTLSPARGSAAST